MRLARHEASGHFLKGLKVGRKLLEAFVTRKIN